MPLPVIGGSDGAWATILNAFLGGAAADGTPTIPTTRVPYMSGENLTSSANLTFDGTTLTVNTIAVTTLAIASLSLSGDLAVNGGDITSTATTFNLLNATVTTGNLFGAGTAITIGAATGYTNFRHSLFINDTVNSFNTLGLTINQGASDNEFFSGKSSDVSHGFTSVAEADTFAAMIKTHATAGGVDIYGFSTTTRAVRLLGNGVTDDTAKTTDAVGYINLLSGKLSGTGIGAPGADANMVVFLDGTAVARFIFDVEGTGHADVAWTTFDKYHDLALMDAMQVEVTNRLTPARYGENSLYYNRGFLEKAGIVGKDSWHFEDRPDGRREFRAMVNFTKLAMLHHGAILQVGDKINQHDERLERLERKILEWQNGAI